MSFFLFNAILIFIILFLLLVLSMVWPPDSPWAPWWRTSKKVAQVMCRLAKVEEKDVVYELGSGDATAIITASKEFGSRGIGIEIDPLRFFISSMLLHSSGVQNKIQIKRKNFFDEDLSSATVIFVYLVPKALNRLLPKFQKELKKGTRIVSYRYKINLPLEKYDRENNLRLYTIK